MATTIRGVPDPVSCRRFEELLRIVESREWTAQEINDYREHTKVCPTGRHAKETLLKELGLPERALTLGHPASGLLSSKERLERIKQAARHKNDVVRKLVGRKAGQPVHAGMEGGSVLEVAHNVSTELREVYASVSKRQNQRRKRRSVRKEKFRKLLERFKSAGIRQEGHIKFLRGCRVGPFYRFGALLEDRALFSEVSEACRKSFLPTIRSVRPDFLVCRTATMRAIGHDLADAMEISRSKVLHAIGSERPAVLVPREECAGKRVAILVDAVLSGSGLEQVCRVVQDQLRAEVVFIGSIVNQGYEGKHAHLLKTVCVDSRDSYQDPCLWCQEGQTPLYFNHGTSTVSRVPTGQERREDWKRSADERAEWWSWMDEKDALREHVQLGRAIYTAFVETKVLLEDESIRESILSQAVERVLRIAGSGPMGGWVLAFKSGRDKRGEQFGELLKVRLGWKSIGVKEWRGKWRLESEEADKVFESNVLMVDAAVNTGKTMGAMASLLLDSKAISVAGLVMINRLSTSEAKAVASSIGAMSIEGLFHFPLPGIRIPESVAATGTKAADSEKVAQKKRGFRPTAERSARNRKAAKRIVHCEAEGRPVESLAECQTVAELNAVVRMMPKSFGRYEEVRQGLCEVVWNGVPNRLKARVVGDLISMGCFEWLNDGWLESNLSFLGSSHGECIVSAVDQAIAEDPRLRLALGEELEQVLEGRPWVQGQGELPFVPQGVVEERLGELLQLVREA